MKFLIFSDTHFSDNPRDDYRFGLFPWLAEQQKIYKPDAILHLGDITQEKNRHSSELVNKIIEGFRLLKPPIYINRGNHDGLDPENPFFKFVNEIEGITFCIETTFIEKYNVFMLPHQSSQAALDTAFKLAPEGCLCFMHQTVTSAISETGARLTGLTVPPNKARALLSGDVHKPQVCIPHISVPVTYIGSPFHVTHGNDYKPRVLLLDNDKETNLYFPAPKKLSLTIRDISEIPKLNKGDQVKVTLELARSEIVEWANHKKAILAHCKQHEVEIYGVDLKVEQARKRPRLEEPSTSKSNSDYFQAFCTAEKVPAQIKSVGLKIINGGKE